jgi:hypothetical protein
VLRWICFGVKNLADISVEMSQHRLITNIIPKTFKTNGNNHVAINNNQDAEV